MILFSKGIIRALISLRELGRLVCAFDVRKPPKTCFVTTRPIFKGWAEMLNSVNPGQTAP